jgi:hypothetical protein
MIELAPDMPPRIRITWQVHPPSTPSDYKSSIPGGDVP